MERFESTVESPSAEGRSPRSPSRRASSHRKKSGRSRNSYLGLGRALGSDRDRQRLREQNAAERTRVERMLAQAPASLDPPADLRAAARDDRRRSAATRLRGVTSRAGERACPVCASGKVVRDEVGHTSRHTFAHTLGHTPSQAVPRAVSRTGTLSLCECLHCDHRWTEQTRGQGPRTGDAARTGAGDRERVVPAASRALA